MILNGNKLVKAMLEVIAEVVDCSSVSKPLSLAVEALSYLSIFIEAKKAIATLQGGEALKLIMELVEKKDASLNYGIAQILQNLVTSTEDLKRAYDSEIEQLKQMAAKGLKINQEKEVINNKAGEPKAISILRKIVVDLGGVQALYSAFHVQVEERKGMPLSENVQSCLARILLHLSSDGHGELRGKLVQQRAMRLLLDLVQSTNQKCKDDASLALARIGISINPALYPVGVCEDMALPLIRFLKSTTHELYQFETLLALTNITSANEGIRSTLWKEGAWYDLRMALTSENWKVQVAALEAQTNMVMCDEAIEKFRSDGGDQDIEIFLAFARSDDLQAVLAATGALAMISYDPIVGKKIQSNSRWVETLAKLLEEESPNVLKRVEVIVDNFRAHEDSAPSTGDQVTLEEMD
eukprot:TRINITY_DN2960_c0_g1_i2.p1 TRINITY_DN2960_c0_g1~~TRINITY_DN2960_c0_g1_i2.p1  ORF type:complete len:411 (+),score=111.04 TRINITY_DN2960_c0_g1_i2:1636-2868(+)